jgi:hypothetical protein
MPRRGKEKARVQRKDGSWQRHRSFNNQARDSRGRLRRNPQPDPGPEKRGSSVHQPTAGSCVKAGPGSRSRADTREAVKLVGRGGTITTINGQVPTEAEARDLIGGAGGRILRVDPPHAAPNPHDFDHIHYTTLTGEKGATQIRPDK